MKISRQYLLGLGSGLILSALIALLFNSVSPSSPSTGGTKNFQQSTSAESSSGEPSQVGTQTAAISSTQESVTSTQNSQKSFVIPPGASADKIAQLLQTEGWIQNKEDFLSLVKAQKLEKRFRVGTYELTSGSSIGNIISQLIQ